ncbi:hypothetical protein AB0C96_33685 [Streptomyces sp. NPDC048506]|uniref:hypothetical protein n=1 Tax=Streptomyces sp. NPDC048506 TaxID=3155028 RepID=UPI00341E3EB3
MGWTILYIAFGLVAVWLLGEVLLQYKARLRWRLLAFAGFLGVVVGVVIPSVIVIGVGLLAFAFGQTQVTLSFKRGFTTGWALGGKPGESRRRRARPSGPPATEPTLQVSDVEAVPAGEPPADLPGPGIGAGGGGPETFESTGGFRSVGGFQNQDTYAGQGSYGYQTGDYEPGDPYRTQDPYQDPQDQSVFATQAFPAPSYDAPPTADRNDYARADTTAVYAPEPLPEETGQYGIYSADARTPQADYTGYDVYGNTAGSGAGDGNGYAYGGSYGQPAAGQDGYADPYAAYGDGQGQQQPYADPYAGAQQYSAPYDPYAQPDPYAAPAYGAQQYDGQGGPLGQSPGQGYGEASSDGAWVPQQRDGELPPEQPPYPPYQQQGYDGQQFRY